MHRVFGFASKNRARRKAAGAFFEGGRYVGTPSIGRSGAVFEAPTFVPGLDDIAVVSEPVEHGRSHFGVAEDVRPFAEDEIGGDDD